jgi:hypothetical protein
VGWTGVNPRRSRNPKTPKRQEKIEMEARFLTETNEGNEVFAGLRCLRFPSLAGLKNPRGRE